MKKLSKEEFYSFLRGENIPRDIALYPLEKIFIDDPMPLNRRDCAIISLVKLSFKIKKEDSSLCLWDDVESPDAEFVKVPTRTTLYEQTFIEGCYQHRNNLSGKLEWIPFLKNDFFSFYKFEENKVSGNWNDGKTTFQIL